MKWGIANDTSTSSAWANVAGVYDRCPRPAFRADGRLARLIERHSHRAHAARACGDTYRMQRIRRRWQR